MASCRPLRCCCAERRRRPRQGGDQADLQLVLGAGGGGRQQCDRGAARVKVKRFMFMLPHEVCWALAGAGRPTGGARSRDFRLNVTVVKPDVRSPRRCRTLRRTGRPESAATQPGAITRTGLPSRKPRMSSTMSGK